MKNFQALGSRKEGQPSNVLWIGYPPSVQIDEQMLHNAMILFGEIERIKSFPSRHYSFVEFRNVEEAMRAKEGLQGRLFNDSRISIMFSSSELAPGKDYPSFYPGAKGPRADMFNEHPLGAGQMEVLDNQRPMSLNQFSSSLQHSSVQRPNVPIRTIGPQGSFDLAVPGAEFNDLASMHNLREPNWRRQSPPAPGILPSPALRFRQSVRSSTGWDVLDVHQDERETKRSRIDDHGLGLEGIGASDRAMLGLSPNLHGKSRLSPVGARPTIRGQPLAHSDVDYIWRGLIAKGGTPVCHARCVPIGNGIGSDLPEVVNCSARTGLDMLTKHYAEAIGFDVVFFLPDSEDDFAPYTEFLRYLGTKNRAGVAKLDDGTTLFLVPPSEFLSEVLKVTGPQRLYGVVLKLPQQVPDSSSLQPQLHRPINFPQHIDRNHIPHQEAEFNVIPQKEEQVMPVDYARVLHEDSKLMPKSFYQSTESIVAPAVPQTYMPNNTPAVSQSRVSLTPELISTLASLVPANTQSSASGSGQLVPSSSTVRLPLSSVASDQVILPQGLRQENPVSGNTLPLQGGNQFAVQSQFHSQFQHHQPVSNVSSHLTNVVPSNTQILDPTTSIVHQGAIQSRSLTNFASPNGQFALPPQVIQQYQIDAPHSSQVQAVNYSHSQSGMPLTAENVNRDNSNQGQQVQTAIPANGQGTSEFEADKNQRYQSTLQFAANLLLQIQQQQQTSSSGVRGSGNQQ
uniref:Flowering time control protein FPA-like n=1 Tax=Rhizophora mucronata TaxID=61149 RepID=A0A2P2M7E3_RHIMU